MAILYDSLLAVCFFALFSFTLVFLIYYESREGYVMGANAPAIALGWVGALPIFIYRGISVHMTKDQHGILMVAILGVALFMMYVFYCRLVRSGVISLGHYVRNTVIVAALIVAFVFLNGNPYLMKTIMAVLTMLSGVALMINQARINRNEIHYLWRLFIGIAMGIFSISMYLEYYQKDMLITMVQAVGIVFFTAGLLVNYFDTIKRTTDDKFSMLESQNRKLFEAEVQVLKYAYKDQITGLPNYASLYRMLTSLLSGRRSTDAFLLYMDLDDFRRVNTLAGFAEGNDLLKKCGELIGGLLSSRDRLFRINGSRFALVHFGSMETSCSLAKTIIDAVNSEETLRINTYFRQGMSIGITEIETQKDYNTILNQAEIAMYKVKGRLKNNYECFNELHEQEYKNLLALEAKLKNAANENVWKIYLQPQISIQTGAVLGVEALIRWFDGERFIPPDEFIPLAEKSGLIVRIGADVIQKVFAIMKDCQSKFDCDIKFSINVSAVEIFDEKFVERMAGYIEQYDVNPKLVTLELTETSLLENLGDAQAIMAELKGMQLSISIDDFGSGFTSLSYLSRLPIDEVKIDKGFIEHIVDNEKDKIMLGHFTALCHDLGLRVVAEGVETKEQLDYISYIGCDLYQGYYFSKPLSYEDLCIGFEKRRMSQSS